MARLRISLVLAAFAVTLPLAETAPAAQLEPIGEFRNPIFVTSDPTDPERLFVVERGGATDLPRIMLVDHAAAPTTFFDASTLSSPGITSGTERGLLSMAFAPDYPTSGRFYIAYTGDDSGTLHVDELTADPGGATASASTRRSIISVPHPVLTSHNGGQLELGPDGYLYVSTGDGGGGADPFENAQDLGSLLGKVLRIAPTAGGGYTVPSDNPFAGAGGGVRHEIWSYGLRNPYRFSFDRLTGDLLIGDVGQDSWEEVNFDPLRTGAGRGDNFGWDCYEGRHAFELTADCPAIGSTTQPVLEYPHPPPPDPGSPDPLSAVAGGYVVRDPSVCELYGRYVYTDVYAGDLRSFVPMLPDALDDRSEGIPVPFTNSFGEDAAGHVYIVFGGSVYRIVHTPGAACPSPATADTSAPALTLIAAAHQSIADHHITVMAGVDEQSIVALSAVVTKGKADKRLFDLAGQTFAVQEGQDEQVSFQLARKQARKLRRLLHRGRRVEAHFSGSATDAAGNHGAGAGTGSRLRG